MSRRGPADMRVYWSRRERALVYSGSKATGGRTLPRTKRGDGATARRLERLLEKAGYVVDFMMPTRGYYLHTVADCWRWEAWGWAASDTDKCRKLHFYSWDTMTECVCEGIVVDIDEDGACWVSSLKSTGGRTTPEIAHRGRGGV